MINTVTWDFYSTEIITDQIGFVWVRSQWGKIYDAGHAEHSLSGFPDRTEAFRVYVSGIEEHDNDYERVT